MGQVGTMVNAGTQRGRTLSKSLRLMVAMVATPSRSATATSEASVPPSRRSAYWRTSSDIRRRSASVRFTERNRRAGSVPTESRNCASAFGPPNRSMR